MKANLHQRLMGNLFPINWVSRSLHHRGTEDTEKGLSRSAKPLFESERSRGLNAERSRSVEIRIPYSSPK
ncbi:hypothetical protein CKA32_006009 [Geitlerinema sp. FC II]|nr:hypothetical protein CKA32_006009 [Geitlerinema sp. FC II]